MLNAEHVSLWSGIQYVGQVVSQMAAPFISDRYGRKFGMFVFLGLMLIVSFPDCFTVFSQTSKTKAVV